MFDNDACPSGVTEWLVIIKIPVTIIANIATILIIANQNSASPNKRAAIKFTPAKTTKKIISTIQEGKVGNQYLT